MEKLLVLLVFAAISAIASAIKESKNKKAQQQAAENEGMGMSPAPSKPTRVQSEISQFLSGLPPAGNSGSAPSESRPVRTTPGGGSNQGRPAGQPKPKKQKRKTDPSTLTDRHVKSSVGQHVDSYIGEHVRKHMDTQVDDYVKRDISDHVASHIGEQSRTDEDVTNAASAGEIRAFLKDPRSVKTAMILNEILSPPRALRSRKRD